MRPITADNTEGRALLALRAGPMTTTELNERLNTSVPAWIIKVGYVEQSNGNYRMTEAGRAACPFRNPLAAKVRPAIQEAFMPRENVVTRHQVLDVISAAGQAGISRKDLIKHFNCADQVIDNHILFLSKAASIFKPEKGRVCGAEFANRCKLNVSVSDPVQPQVRHPSRVAIMEYLGKVGAPRMAVTIANDLEFSVEGTQEVLHGLYSDLKIERVNGERGYQYTVRAVPEAVGIMTDEQITNLVESLEPEPEATAPLMAEMHELATKVETINIQGIADRRGPITMMHPDETEIGIFSSGRVEITDEFNSVMLTEGVVRKLRQFLGLFGEAA